MEATKVRVRFAPSPSGDLHVGGARTAFFNYIFARQNKGKFLLRFEDTDKSRSTNEAIANIMASLRWLGLRWGEVPYRQSNRQSLYERAAKLLLDEKKAYYCFCPKGGCTLNCRSFDEKKIAQYQAKEVQPTVRLATPTTGTTTFEDLIKGKISVENKNIDDYIIMRSDGGATYNLAVVVDDQAMEISHVIRGDDHLSNTPRQIALYQALGYQIPQFAHLPLIAGSDKKPLSKRHGDVSIEEFKKQGYLPEAVLNYLALLGWGYDEKSTFFTVDDLLEKFSLERVSKNPAVWDSKKLLWLNGEYIRRLAMDEFMSEVKRRLQRLGICDLNQSRFEMISRLIQDRIKTFSEAAPLIEFFYRRVSPDDSAIALLRETKDSAILLRRVIEALKLLNNFRYYEIENDLRFLAETLKIKPALLFQLIRVSVSGRTVSPPLFESMEILGKEESIKRIENSIYRCIA